MRTSLRTVDSSTLDLEVIERLRDVPDAHLATISALRRRDPDAAAEALRTHIREARADLVAHWPDSTAAAPPRRDSR